MSWLRVGVRAAHRRYWRANTDLFTLGNYTFKKLDGFSSRLIRDLEEGEEVVIAADIDRCEFSATVNGKRL